MRYFNFYVRSTVGHSARPLKCLAALDEGFLRPPKTAMSSMAFSLDFDADWLDFTNFHNCL